MGIASDIARRCNLIAPINCDGPQFPVLDDYKKLSSERAVLS